MYVLAVCAMAYAAAWSFCLLHWVHMHVMSQHDQHVSTSLTVTVTAARQSIGHLGL